MSHYRDQVLQAQRKAEVVNLLKKNNFLSTVNSNDVTISNENTFVPVIRNWYRVGRI